jgi:hypothetical protein
MRGHVKVNTLVRNVLREECNCPSDTLTRYYGFPAFERVEIVSKIGKYRNAERFISEWKMVYKGSSRLIRPPSIREMPHVQDERHFFLLNDCDAKNGMQATGPLTREDFHADFAWLIMMLDKIRQISTVGLQRECMKRRLRVTEGAAMEILSRMQVDGVGAEQLAYAVVPHFQLQATAARRWLERRDMTLTLDLSGMSILQRLK